MSLVVEKNKIFIDHRSKQEHYWEKRQLCNDYFYTFTKSVIYPETKS